MIQDIEIYSTGREYVVRGQIDHELLLKTRCATKAIQHAIDTLPDDGGEVLLQRGIYVLNNPVALSNRVVLKGKGRGTKLVVPEENSEGIGVLVNGLKGAQLQDLTLTPEVAGTAFAGIVVDDSGDCQIENVLAQSFESFGIKVCNNSFLCEISSCRLVDTGKANLFMKDLSEEGRAGNFLPNIVSHLTIYGGGVGIECDNALVVNITGCVVFQSRLQAFHIHSNSNSVLISGCRTFQVETDAVVVKDSHEINISSNIFCWHRGHGIILDGVKWGSVSANNVIDSGVRAKDGELRNGIEILNDTRSVQVTGNAVFSWGDQVPMEYGIIEDESCAYNLISSNNINFYTEDAVVSKGANSEAMNNLAGGSDAWIGMDREGYPDFVRDPIEAIIKQ